MNHTLALADWLGFYTLVGSSAAALTGLTFVVVTVASERRDDIGSATARLRGLRVFITPTAVHFGTALGLSALMCIPGQTTLALAVALAVTGLAGLIYCATLVRQMLGNFPGYKPFLSDWIWSAVFPVAAYLAVAASGFMLPALPAGSLYTAGGAVLLLLFIGIHNAWDVVVWMTTERHAHRERQRRSAEGTKDPPP